MSATIRIGACLSLSGRFSMFGKQAACGLQSWAALAGNAEIQIIDDRSDPGQVAPALSDLINSNDLLLGPYSTQLMRAANKVVANLDRLLWNHGGSGDDVEKGAPGHVISVLSPTSSYADSYVRMLASHAPAAPLWLRSGKGRFGVQVIDGAERTAARLGLRVHRLSPTDDLPSNHDQNWSLFCAATFDEDVATVRQALALPRPPRVLGAVAAGVQHFAHQVSKPNGIYGVAQWMAGSGAPILLGPPEREFIRQYSHLSGRKPDYPAVQAAAAAALATHCARVAGNVSRTALWAAATDLHTTTLFGPFGIDPTTGEQRDHRPVLTQWTADGLRPVR